jgi:hypothetical protein
MPASVAQGPGKVSGLVIVAALWKRVVADIGAPRTGVDVTGLAWTGHEYMMAVPGCCGGFSRAAARLGPRRVTPSDERGVPKGSSVVAGLQRALTWSAVPGRSLPL